MRLLSFASVILIAFGCAPQTDRPMTVPVRVQVVYKGAPVEGAAVTFLNPDGKRTGFGTTDADGLAHLMTFQPKDGVVPGPQQISVRKVEVIERKKDGVDYSTTSDVPPPPEERWHLPKKYADPKTSGLTAEVTTGKEPIVLELKD